MRTELTIHSAETPDFVPFVDEVAEDVKSLVSAKHRIVCVHADQLALATSHAVVTTPQLLANFARIGQAKDAAKTAAWFLNLEELPACLAVVKCGSHYEVMIRMHVGNHFVDATDDAQRAHTYDTNRLRRLPGAVLNAIMEKMDVYKFASEDAKKRLVKALKLVGDDCDEVGSKCRVDFADEAFEVVSKAKALPTIAKMVPTKAEERKKRVREEDMRVELAKHVKLTALPNGTLAFTFVDAASVALAGETVVVTPFERESMD